MGRKIIITLVWIIALALFYFGFVSGNYFSSFNELRLTLPIRDAIKFLFETDKQIVLSIIPFSCDYGVKDYCSFPLWVVSIRFMLGFVFMFVVVYLPVHIYYFLKSKLIHQ